MPIPARRKAGTLPAWHGLPFHRGATGGAMKYWTIDVIKSFMDGEVGEQEKQIIYRDPSTNPLSDHALWGAGKRAFEVFRDEMYNDVSDSHFDLVFTVTAVELLNALKWWLTKFLPHNPEITVDDAAQQIVECSRERLQSLGYEMDSPLTALAIEPHIERLYGSWDYLNLRFSKNLYSVEQERIAAYFTLSRVNAAAAAPHVTLLHIPTLNNPWYWFEKIERHKFQIEAVEAKQQHDLKEKSKTMNSIRHAKRNDAMQLVTNDWAARKDDFNSAEKAGIYYADWLAEKGMTYEPRTVMGWIRKFAKENSIKLR